MCFQAKKVKMTPTVADGLKEANLNHEKRHIMFFETLTWRQITDLCKKKERKKENKNTETVWADTVNK